MLRLCARRSAAALRPSPSQVRVRANSSLAENAVEPPYSRRAFKQRHAESDGGKQSRGAMIAERAVVPGGPGADRVAMPRPPPSVPKAQSPNAPNIWSTNQNPRQNAMRGARFEQTAMAMQPQPLSAMQMISEEPIRLVEQRIASCDGGGGSLGHPKVFINLDKPGPKACGYCGLRFERADHDHPHH